jgi:hypothetical protein
MASTSCQFRWRPLQPGEIRLLRPEFIEDGVVTAHLSQLEMKSAPPYLALSYVCGRDEPGHFILCSQDLNPAPMPITITPNLSEALVAVMQLRAERLPAIRFDYLWIDSICINQVDLDEKADQVANMGKIYIEAAKVLIWLGNAENDSDRAIMVLNDLAAFKSEQGHRAETQNPRRDYVSESELSALHAALEAKAKIIHSEDAFRALGLPHFNSSFWPALVSLFSRPWFFRLWTFQEAALAKSAVVICGTSTISWNNFRSLGLSFVDTELLYRSLSALKMPRQNNVSVDRREALISTFQFTHDEAGTWFPLYVRQARLREVTVPADRIFAIRALASKAMQARIPVAYSAEPGSQLETFKVAAKAILHEYTYSTILSQVNSKNKPLQLPSWCPDFDSVSEESAFPTSLAVGRNYNKYFREDPHSSSVIYMGGAVLDTVDRVISDFDWRWPQEDFSSIYGLNGEAAHTLTWLDTCERLVAETVGNDGDRVQSVYLSALLAEIRSRPPFNFPPEPAASLAALRERLTALKTSTPETIPPITTSEQRLMQPFFGYLGILWPNRLFYSTTGGRFGIASRNTRPGDKICTLMGESQLFVFRPQGAKMHRCIGESYVTQLSEGEGFKDVEEKMQLLGII